MRTGFRSRYKIISFCFLVLASMSVLAQEVGVPLTGEMGITLTVDALSRRCALTAAADAATPARVRPRLRPDRGSLPDNPASLSLATPQRTAAVNGGTIEPSTVVVSTAFTGATLADTGAFPPDTMGAVGPSQFVVAVNGRIRSFNKTTGVADGALNLSMDSFFASVMTPIGGAITNNFTSDPHIRYDRLSGRWIVNIIDVPNFGAATNRVLLAVSSGSTISGAASFTFFQFSAPPVGTGVFADYPTLGIDANALYIGVNMFTAAGAFAGTSGYVVRKSSILGAGPIVSTAFNGLVATPAGAGPFTPQGVDNYAAVAAEGYFIGVDNATFGKLMIRRVTTPGATPAISADIALTVPTTTSPATVPHLGNTGGTNGNLDGSDDRLYAAHLRNGRLWTAHAFRVNASGVASTAAGARNGTRWYEIQNLTTAPTLVQSGTVFDSAATNPLAYWMPTVVVSGQGHAYMGFSSAGAAASANAAATVRWSGDPFGTTQPVTTYTASATAYNPPGDSGGAGGRRWGDYSYTSLDPEDDMTAWTIQQFCDATNSYGVRVAKLLAPPPPPTLTAAPSSIAAARASVNIVITGSGITAAAAQGFYDPGSGFAKRLAASIPGLVVNSVTFTSLTSITVNVSTVGATTGSKNVTVTNPDGQAVTSNGLLTITAASVAPAITSAASTTFTTGIVGTFAVTTSGTPTPAITRTGALPSGVGFVDNGNGTATLSGTAAAGTGGTYPITLTAANTVMPNATQSFTLTVNQPPAFISSAPTGTGVIGTAYTHTYAASGFPASFTYSVATGALPGGLSLTSGVISGTPTTAGTFTGTVNVSNAVLPNAAQAFSIVISKSPQSISFPAVTAFSWYQGSATLAATATSTLAVSYAVVSGPCSLAGSVLTATGPGSCVISADQPGNATFASAAQQTQSVTINVGPTLLDIDASGANTRYDPATDGVMVLRYLLGFSVDAIAASATGATATRSAAQIGTHLTTIQTLLDIDGDGTPRAPTDGLLIVRYLLGLRGSALVAGIPIGVLTPTQIEARISRLMP